MEKEVGADPRSHEFEEEEYQELCEAHEKSRAAEFAYDRAFERCEECRARERHLAAYFRFRKHKPTSFYDFLTTYVSRSYYGDPVSDIGGDLKDDRGAPQEDFALYHYLERRLPYRALTALKRARKTYLERR